MWWFKISLLLLLFCFLSINVGESRHLNLHKSQHQNRQPGDHGLMMEGPFSDDENEDGKEEHERFERDSSGNQLNAKESHQKPDNNYLMDKKNGDSQNGYNLQDIYQKYLKFIFDQIQRNKNGSGYGNGNGAKEPAAKKKQIHDLGLTSSNGNDVHYGNEPKHGRFRRETYSSSGGEAGLGFVIWLLIVLGILFFCCCLPIGIIIYVIMKASKKNNQQAPGVVHQ
uniref:Transmembrane protein n=1 Tax=Panagrolaimus sp. ES5 TaxID=591445 RepID=A0AC34FH75_9BILA